MTGELDGKRALVTGSNSGLGEAIAKRLAREGARLVVHGRNAERAERVAAEIRATGAEAHVAVGDLMLDDQANAVADAAEAALGGIDILVNNAGGESSGHGQATFFEAKPEEWLKTYNGNVVCAIRLIQRLAPGMKERGWGRIIQISSLVSHRPNLVIPDYAAAKAALNNMTVGLARTLGGTGVTVNSISPGVILTSGVEGWFRNLAQQFGWGHRMARDRKTRHRRAGAQPVRPRRPTGRYRPCRPVSRQPAGRLRHRDGHDGERRIRRAKTSGASRLPVMNSQIDNMRGGCRIADDRSPGMVRDRAEPGGDVVAEQRDLFPAAHRPSASEHRRSCPRSRRISVSPST